jgi:hypothetical protein
MIAWAERTLATPLQIRLIKGAYWDLQTRWRRPKAGRSVFDGKEIRRELRALRAVLVAHTPRAGAASEASAPIRPAFGSHNLRASLAITGRRGCRRRRYRAAASPWNGGPVTALRLSSRPGPS